MTICLAATVIAPGIENGRLLSGYGVRRGRTTGQPTMHAGIDIGGGRGTYVYAVRPGVVERIASNDAPVRSPFGGYGNAVVVRHDDDGLWSFYAHLERVTVQEGEEVVPGQPVGVMGATTNGKFPGMGRHLHFEARHAKPDGSSPFPGGYGRFNIDPMEWLTSLGLGFDRGGPTIHPEHRSVCPSPQRDERYLERLDPHYPTYRSDTPLLRRSGTGGLRGLGSIDDNADYEPPVADPSYFRGTPLWLHIVGALGLAAVGSAGAFLYPKVR